jgi:hypothetical protein
MIKVFGKIRYHWQPELATSLVYWCWTLTVFFFALIFTLEETHLYWLSFVVFSLFLFFVLLGIHRHFELTEDGHLKIVAILPRNDDLIPIDSISKVLLTPKGIEIYSSEWDKGHIYYMRNAHRIYFIDALDHNELFKGEFIHAQALDYEDKK